MSKLKELALVAGVMATLLVSTPAWAADDEGGTEVKPLRGSECRSLFVAISTERPTGQEVGLLVSNANLQALGADVDIFLADGAAYLALPPLHWDPAQYDASDPALLGLHQQLLGLMAAGAKVLGCPPCVERALDPALGIMLFVPNPGGDDPPFVLDEAAWEAAVIEGVVPISPDKFVRIYDRRVRDGECTHIEQSVISF
ncbi:MAG: hypothetical protein PVG98_10440 [Chromatiales bacterium]|jgi:hypothetical protein